MKCFTVARRGIIENSLYYSDKIRDLRFVSKIIFGSFGFIFRPCSQHYSLKLDHENQSSSKAARAAETLDLFLDFLEKPNPNLTNLLSRVSGTGSDAEAGVSSSITCSDLLIVGRLGLMDPSVDDLASSSSESPDSSSDVLLKPGSD